MSRRPCIVLGASGLVGQRLQQRLIDHPFFELKAVSGSKQTAGKPLKEVDWRLEQERPNLPDIVVLDLDSDDFISTLISLEIEVAFSALPDEIAFKIEAKLDRIPTLALYLLNVGAKLVVGARKGFDSESVL